MQLRFFFIDIFWSALSPFLALYVRDAYVLSYDGALIAGLYVLVSFGFSLIAFAVFGARDGMSRYFSVHEVIDLVKAVLIGELMTCVVLFTFTRLEGIPRSTPIIHALILGAAVIMSRALAHIASRDPRRVARHRDPAGEQIILIGLNDLSSLYVGVLEAFARGQQQVVAVLDERPTMIGRSVHGARVFGPPTHLQSLIEEFDVHGVRISRVIVGGDADSLSKEAMQEIESVCAKREVTIEFLPQLFGLGARRGPAARAPSEIDVAPADSGAESPAGSIALPSYFRIKPFVDVCLTLVLIIALFPVWLLVASLVFVDVGFPVLFWQQRSGLNGRNFLLHKFRTLQLPFDWQGQEVPQQQRLSAIGRMLRKLRLDELPQLLNVLVGDMSLIGPRPLLPQDQPPTPSVRLMVRPGITGWAQVNGGVLLSAQEKDELDEWYIRHASFWLDMRILALTFLSLVRGDRRYERALAQARGRRGTRLNGEGSVAGGGGLSSHPTISVAPPLKDDSESAGAWPR